VFDNFLNFVADALKDTSDVPGCEKQERKSYDNDPLEFAHAHDVFSRFGGLPPSLPFSRAMARMRSIPSRLRRAR